MRLQNTYTLIRTAIRKLLHSLTRKADFDSQLLAGLKLNYQERKKPAIDWSNAEAREALLNDLVNDALRVLEVTATLPLTETEPKLRTILEKVTFQDIDPKADGKEFQIKMGVAEDRLISTVDHDMRHGRKSAARTFNGYKTHIAMVQEFEFIGAVEVTPGNIYDGQVAKDLIDQQPEDRRPQRMIGDHCYGAGPICKGMEERHIEVVDPVTEARDPRWFSSRKSTFKWTLRPNPAVSL